MSGAAEYIDRTLDGLEDSTYVLSEDGSSAHVLLFVLEQEMIAQEVDAF